MKRTYRIYKEMGMQLRNKTPKRRVKAKLRDDRAEAVGQNDVWAMRCPNRRLQGKRREGASSTTSWRRAARSGC